MSEEKKKKPSEWLTLLCKVTKDGIEKFKGTKNDCWKYIHDSNGSSVYWACKYDGWEIEEVKGA